MTQQATLLTWADVLKLCVPFAFSLLLIWAKLEYENRRERKAKQAFLWRTISNEQPNFPVALDEFLKIAKAAECGSIRIVAFDIPSKVSTFADRLAELDTKKSYIYSAYSSQIEIVRNGLCNKKDLEAALVCSADKEIRARIVNVLKAQTVSLRKDLVTLARRELDVLRVIHGQNPKFDQQVIDQQSKLIDQASGVFEV